ncbi:phage tail protein [Brevibacillus migulae]|uniref:phage tail protein n=1 Tax=Brevibacillus migulae TaxID=1644114 RepID=UPI00106EA317|nr:tail fiber protein [Brevibacillus migulae]
MSDPFIGEIRMFAGNFPPKGWAFCNGQLLSISQNTALYSILGTQYGGDGKTNFALPNLKGSAPMHPGAGPGLSPRGIGEKGGSPSVTLTLAQMPPHNHQVQEKATANVTSPIGAVWANNSRFGENIYASEPDGVTSMNQAALSQAGENAPHNNMQPYLGVNFIISLQGVFPSRG